MLKDNVERTCETHPTRWDCPNLLIEHCDDGDYGIMIYGTNTAVVIAYCPWCGADLKNFANPS